MDNQTVNKKVRRYNSYLSTFNINLNYLTNPWIPTLWAFTFPGFGHLLLGMFVEGYILIIWEVFVNSKSHLNEAMMYSFTGDFESAKKALKIKWALLYISVYIFSAWDSYRSTVVTNNLQTLAEREKAKIVPFVLSAFSMVYLEKLKPRVVGLWSFFMPGLGQIILHRIPTGFFILSWWIFLCYKSNLPMAIYYTLTGSFHKTTEILNPQWFLFIPSLYVFAVYDAYIFSAELNNLFKIEQANYLKSEYQNKKFLMPRKRPKMY